MWRYEDPKLTWRDSRLATLVRALGSLAFAVTVIGRPKWRRIARA
jgi:hypothetical protein